MQGKLDLQRFGDGSLGKGSSRQLVAWFCFVSRDAWPMSKPQFLHMNWFRHRPSALLRSASLLSHTFNCTSWGVSNWPLIALPWTFSRSWILRKLWRNGTCFKQCCGMFLRSSVDLFWCWVSHLDLQYFIWLNWALCAQMLAVALDSFFWTSGPFHQSSCSCTPWCGQRLWRKRPAECHLWSILGPLKTRLGGVSSRRNKGGWILNGNIWYSTLIKARLDSMCKAWKFGFFRSRRCVTILAQSYSPLSHKAQCKPVSEMLDQAGCHHQSQDVSEERCSTIQCWCHPVAIAPSFWNITRDTRTEYRWCPWFTLANGLVDLIGPHWMSQVIAPGVINLISITSGSTIGWPVSFGLLNRLAHLNG